jgi:hypothetical protein
MTRRIPLGTTAPAASTRVAVTDAASATQTLSAPGIYTFKVNGSDVHIRPWLEGSALTPSTSTGLHIAESDGPVDYECPAGTKFQAICAAGQTADLFYWKSAP